RIAQSSKNELTIRTEWCVHPNPISFEKSNLSSPRNIPNSRRSVGRCRRQQLTIGTELNIDNIGGVTRKPNGLVPARRVPYEDAPVLRCRRNLTPVSADSRMLK